MEHSRSPKAMQLPCVSASTCISIWRGRSMYFSTKTRSSPNALMASLCALLNPFSTSSSVQAIRMPLPPPPADALSMTGQPISVATCKACCGESNASVCPGTVLTLAVAASFFDSILSPMTSIARILGPIKRIPACSSACANSAFSDRKPKPGCTASAPVCLQASMMASILR